MNIFPMWCSLVVLVCWAPACSLCAPGPDGSDSDVVISLRPGQELRGLQKKSASGSLVYTFYGIPYALPPTGPRRFKQPEAVPDWSGVKDAVKKGAICPQDGIEDASLVSSEDCLFLNVFTPDVNASLPVFVWIHGGGFRYGSAFGDGDGATLAPQGLVSVTINYRLGGLGFLSTGDDVMPGNYGMLDQVLALKWVQKYIKSFGGNPSQVTIGGESAGAFSVSALILSPLAKGLFNRAVSESGSAVSIASFARPKSLDNLKTATLRSVRALGCNKSTSLEILQCLQTIDADVLTNATRDASTTPRVETVFGFLPDEPINLIRKGGYNKVDTLDGTNSGEFSRNVQDLENDGISLQEFADAIKRTIAGFVDEDEIAKLIIQAYVGNEIDPIKLRSLLVHAANDLSFVSGALYELNTFASEASSTTKHFFYEFDYRVSGTTTPVWQGVAHADERRFVFYPDSRFQYNSQTDRDVGESVQKMWANFIKYGDPTPSNNTTPASNAGKSVVSWRPFLKNDPNILNIDANSTLVSFPRTFLLPLFDKILQIVDKNEPVVG